jgi:alpha-tubulin suppressor-like RCC1 family protein
MKLRRWVILLLVSGVAAVQADPFGWGVNGSGQLGDGTTTDRLVPVAADVSGVLAGKTITALSAYGESVLALGSDGKAYGWGANGTGQLGDGTTTHRLTPVALDMSGVLSGTTVTAIEAGLVGGLAIGSDGRAYAWGDNSYGQLGDGTTTRRTRPVAVDDSGVLSGKTITTVAAGMHSLALSADGELFAWGYNVSGGVGDGTTVDRAVPVRVDVSGALSGRTVKVLAVGSSFSVVLADAEATTFAVGHARSYAANFGWLNWRALAPGLEGLKPMRTVAWLLPTACLYSRLRSPQPFSSRLALRRRMFWLRGSKATRWQPREAPRMLYTPRLAPMSIM